MSALAVSILICTRNRRESLRETLQSISELVIPRSMRVELVVVDNGSTDGTVDLLDQLCIKSIEIHHLREDTPGVGSARNTALRAASGDVLLFTDDDTRLPMNWLSVMCDPILREEADAVAGCIALAPGLEREWMRPYHRALLASTDLLDLERPQEMFGASMAFSRKVLQRVPAFDPELGPGTVIGAMEDTLFSWQIKEAGYRIVTVTDAIVEHHPDEARLSRASLIQGARHYAQSMAYIYYHWLHLPPPSLRNQRNPYLALADHAMRLARRRMKRALMFRRPMAEGIPRWELYEVQRLGQIVQYLKERKRPYNYERRGLVKRVS